MKKVIILIVMLAVSISFIAASGDKEEAAVSTATDSASSASLDNASLAWEVSGEEIIFTFASIQSYEGCSVRHRLCCRRTDGCSR